MQDYCQICGNKQDNREHIAREMMFGTREPFHYLECGNCGTVQLVDVPDLAEHYPEGYYSFGDGENELESSLKRRFAARQIGRYLATGRGTLGRLFAERRPEIAGEFPESLREPLLGLSQRSRILDVGCGGGGLLRKLSSFGFSDLTGADAFIERDLSYPGNVRVLKAGLDDIKSSYDLIMLHHSFEHLPDPFDALQKIKGLLADGGTCLIRIPVASYAWETYGVNWFQLDPPRHLFLFTAKAFNDIAARAGFEVVKTVYDSTPAQFIVSEQYAADIPMHDPRAYRGDVAASIFTHEQLDEWEELTARLNREGRGDQACFYLKKK